MLRPSKETNMTKPNIEERYQALEKDLEKKLKDINRNYILAMLGVGLVFIVAILGAA